MVETLASGREAFRRHAWEEAVQSLMEADRAEALSAGDLLLLAEAAWWSGNADRAVEAMERAYAAYVDAGEAAPAATVALRLSELAFRRLSVSIANGWLARAERLLEDQPESGAHAWLAFIHTAVALILERDLEGALQQADRALELARRFGNADVESLALSFKGSALVSKGRWADGLALIDEASASAVSGTLAPKAACDVFCTTIAACRDLADYRRAGEWTEEADRWMQRQAIRGYRGVCRVHRAELKRLRGAWAEAEQEARHACDELEEFRLLDAVGFAHNEVGEVRLRMGDLPSAEEAFLRAYEYGREPQPGLSLLLLARGEVEEAARSIARSLSGNEGEQGEAPTTKDLLARSQLLPAQVEIAIAAGDRDTARRATEELEGIASRYGTPALEAAALTARGALSMEEGRLDDAASCLGRAWRRWQEIELPYESARARALLGRVRAAANDEATARLELRAARSTFQRLGAALDLRTVDVLLGEEGGSRESDAPRLARTFVFTDIVTSTDLVGLIGDGAWQELLRWHDRELRSAFARHRGEEVRHTGDGFFVAFEHAGDAIECAVAIQRSLANHRRDHGFAPWVRIGMHTAEASRQGSDYAGQGVHLAARVGALAEREEVLVSAHTLREAGSIRFPVGEGRLVALKGIGEPVEVHTVDWR